MVYYLKIEAIHHHHIKDQQQTDDEPQLKQVQLPSLMQQSNLAGLSTIFSSALTLDEDETVLWTTSWAADLQMDKFIQTDSQQQSPSCQQLLSEIISNCHQLIESQLNSHWLTTLNRYTEMTKNQKITAHISVIAEEVEKRRLARLALKSSLQELAKQKFCFDTAIFLCLQEITNIYRDTQEEIDINDSQAIQNVMHKINLEMNRVSIKLPIYARRYEIQQYVMDNPVVVIKGETGTILSLYL